MMSSKHKHRRKRAINKKPRNPCQDSGFYILQEHSGFVSGGDAGRGMPTLSKGQHIVLLELINFNFSSNVPVSTKAMYQYQKLKPTKLK